MPLAILAVPYYNTGMFQSYRIFNLKSAKPATAVWQSMGVRCHYFMAKRAAGHGLKGDCKS